MDWITISQDIVGRMFDPVNVCIVLFIVWFTHRAGYAGSMILSTCAVVAASIAFRVWQGSTEIDTGIVLSAIAAVLLSALMLVSASLLRPKLSAG